MKKYIMLIIICLLLIGCNMSDKSTDNPVNNTINNPTDNSTSNSSDITQQNTHSTSTEETTPASEQAAPEKPISEYKDNTAKASNTFIPENVLEVHNGNFGIVDWMEIYSNLFELCQHAVKTPFVSIVVGEVTEDISYIGQYEEYSENRVGPMDGNTIYTFAVKDVLYGDDIEAESKITVLEPMNGYMKHKDKEGVYYYTGMYGNVAIGPGDKYVMFLKKGSKSDADYYEIEGEFFYLIGCNMGKYICCDDGMYRRYSPASVDGLYYSEGEKVLFEGPMDLETIKSEITAYINNDNINATAETNTASATNAAPKTNTASATNAAPKINTASATNTSSVTNQTSTNEHTILYSQKIDLNEDGSVEELQVIALGKVDAGKTETVEQFIEDGGVIKFYVIDENGDVYNSYGSDSVKTLYKDMYGNLQIFLTKDDDGNEVILVTQIQENRWMGCYEFNVYDVWQSRGSKEVTYSNYYTKSVSERTENDKWYSYYTGFTKMKKNPVDTMEDARTSMIPEFQHYLEPWLKDAVLLVAVDALHEPLVLYSTNEKQIPASEYFDGVWNREETFVDDGRFYK